VWFGAVADVLLSLLWAVGSNTLANRASLVTKFVSQINEYLMNLQFRKLCQTSGINLILAPYSWYRGQSMRLFN
jgi:hypothetical protein